MLALLAIVVTCDIDRQAKPQQPPPVIPIPTGKVLFWDDRLYTDWRPMTRELPVWRTAKRLDEAGRSEESAIGQRGGRFRELFAQSDSDRTFATTGRNPVGSGGVGEGFEWTVFVGESWTAGLDVEFTASGPRAVVALAHYPFEGVTHRYGWSVLSGQLVHGIGWHFDADELRGLYYWPRLVALMYLGALRRAVGLHQRE
jgi:hypothetical protein